MQCYLATWHPVHSSICMWLSDTPCRAVHLQAPQCVLIHDRTTSVCLRTRAPAPADMNQRRQACSLKAWKVQQVIRHRYIT